MTKAKKFILARHFDGEPKESDLKLVEEELPLIKDGEILAEAVWLSVDPYMRPYSVRLPIGTTMIGSQVAKVVESKNPEYKVGKYIVGSFGWRTKTIVNPSVADSLFNSKIYILPDLGGLSESLGVGVLGMPGNTAYFGFLELCQPQPGEVVVVTGAAGAVGSLVGQIAKIKGCKVIGFAGSDEKVKWIKEDLGFDAAFNYKTKDVTEALKESAPDGVDCYFDNVGGEMSSAIISQMKQFGRISVCGSISAYNNDPSKLARAPILQPSMVFKQLKMEGFLVTRWSDRLFEGIKQNLQWIKEGKLKYHESVTRGFDKMPQAFIGMLRGDNTGKAVISLAGLDAASTRIEE